MKHVWVRPQHQKQSGPVVSFIKDKMALWEARCVISFLGILVLLHHIAFAIRTARAICMLIGAACHNRAAKLQSISCVGMCV